MDSPSSTRWPHWGVGAQPTRPSPSISLSSDPRQSTESTQNKLHQEAEEVEERPEKRRKLGIAETILSTAVSVAIVSTAVGYTAYRLWRDGGTSGAAAGGAGQNDEIEVSDGTKKNPENDWREGTGASANGQGPALTRRHTVREGHPRSELASPPPPYYASYEDSWASYGERQRPRVPGVGRGEATASTTGRTGARHSSQQEYTVRAGPKRGPMAKVHRTLKTSSSPRSGVRPAGPQNEEGGVYGSRKVHGSGAERDERLASPIGRKQADGWRSLHESGATSASRHGSWKTGGRLKETKQVAVAKSDGEELEEGSSRLEEQMDWMSERLRGLIADGKKALGREIVVAEGVADSPLHGDSEEDGVGHSDDGEKGWGDYDVDGRYGEVAGYPGGRNNFGTWTRESPRRSTARKEEPYVHTGRVKALTHRQQSGEA